METQDFWRKCSSCKKPIGWGAKHYVCSVSTCNGQRTGYVFCSVACFEIHLPSARHKDAAAIEAFAPTSGSASSSGPKRTIIAVASSAGTPSKASNVPRDTLIIASRLKDYIQARSEMNTSAQVMDVLSDYVRIVCDRAIENARSDCRKTVLDRDFQFLKK